MIFDSQSSFPLLNSRKRIRHGETEENIDDFQRLKIFLAAINLPNAKNITLIVKETSFSYISFEGVELTFKKQHRTLQKLKDRRKKLHKKGNKNFKNKIKCERKCFISLTQINHNVCILRSFMSSTTRFIIDF